MYDNFTGYVGKDPCDMLLKLSNYLGKTCWWALEVVGGNLSVYKG